MNGNFTERGNVYVLKDKCTKFPLNNYHFNREYFTTVANDLSGKGKSLEPRDREYTGNFRYCIIEDEADIWSVGGAGENAGDMDDYTCEYRLHSTFMQAKKKDLTVCIEAFVPQKGQGEYFIYTLKNQSSQEKKIKVAVAHSLEYSPMDARCEADMQGRFISSFAIPYHIYYDDYEKLAKLNNACFTVSSRKPHRVNCSEFSFFDGKRHNVQSVFNNECTVCNYSRPIAGFIYEISLRPNEEISFWTYTGICRTREDAKAIAEKLLKDENIAEKELLAVKAYFEGLTQSIQMKSSDENLNNFANFWIKKQVLCNAITKRCSKTYCIRNSLQDSMGLSFVDKELAKSYFRECISLQMSDGSIKQHGVWGDIFPPQGLGLLYMRDGPSWLVVCVSNYVNDHKDYDFLQEVLPYKDGGEGTVLEHILKAVDFMWQDRGMFGLSLLGDGDWTDPINGPGRKGKGVSTWTSMAFLWGMRLVDKFLRAIEKTEKADELLVRIEEMQGNILKYCFKDNQFIAGYNDEGIAYGCKDDEEGNIFLNMHSWAIISGAAQGKVLERCIEVIKELIVPFGVLVMKPAFTKWNAKFGKISLKGAGTAENGAVYCHAAMFAVYALFVAGEKDLATKVLKSIMPMNNDKADYETQPPIFFSPFYFAGKTTEFGRASNHFFTGTAAWFLKIYNDFVE